jgi:hypothetical protein
VGRVDLSSVIALLALALLAACPHKNGAGGGTPGFAISYPDAGVMSRPAKVGKHFSAKPAGQCFRDDGTEARWAMSGAKVTSGALPPGLTLEDGELGGVPKTAGTFKATLELGEVTCAGKPYPGQTVDILITVK